MSLMVVKASAGEALFLNDQVIVEYWGNALAIGASNFLTGLAESLSKATGLEVEKYDVGALEYTGEEGQGTAKMLAKAKEMQAQKSRPLGVDEALAYLDRYPDKNELWLASVALFDMNAPDLRSPFKTVSVVVAAMNRDDAEELALDMVTATIKVRSHVRFVVRDGTIRISREAVEVA